MAKKTAGPTPEQIAEAAYHRYLSRGGTDGGDFDDWIEAERALTRSASPKPKSQSPKPKAQGAAKPAPQPRAARKPKT